MEYKQSKDICYVALGSNISDDLSESRAVLEDAIAQIGADTAIHARSPIYRTPCFPAGAGPDFANAVIEIAAFGESIIEMLARLHDIEAAFGRRRLVRWGQRSLDLDLLACGGAVLPDVKTVSHWIELPAHEQIKIAPDQLILPHPRIQDRAFVLGPWRDIAPDWEHPILNLSVQQMWNRLSDADRASIVAA